MTYTRGILYVIGSLDTLQKVTMSSIHPGRLRHWAPVPSAPIPSAVHQRCAIACYVAGRGTGESGGEAEEVE